MKVKLDENLGSRGAEFLRKHNFDVLTVADQGLLTAPDEKVIGVCAGIVVVRIPGRLRLPELERALGLVVEASRVSDVKGRLWIAEVDRLREHLEVSE